MLHGRVKLLCRLLATRAVTGRKVSDYLVCMKLTFVCVCVALGRKTPAGQKAGVDWTTMTAEEKAEATAVFDVSGPFAQPHFCQLT